MSRLHAALFVGGKLGGIGVQASIVCVFLVYEGMEAAHLFLWVQGIDASALCFSLDKVMVRIINVTSCFGSACYSFGISLFLLLEDTYLSYFVNSLLKFLHSNGFFMILRYKNPPYVVFIRYYAIIFSQHVTCLSLSA